jgi:glycolate oxidase FAD binding subunit
VTVLRPSTVGELADMVRESAGAGRALRVRGAGTWPDALAHVRADATLDLGGFSGVLGYTPADLTISVGAATTLAELDAVTAANGQWCPLQPWGTDASTVGATVSTATPGPFAASLGRPRELVIGLECVDGTGRAIRAGGRVVKNVAGFDLTRTMTGQWGTLGVLTAVHLRLRARPAEDVTCALSAGTGAGSDGPDSVIGLAMREFVRGPYAPLACVPLTPALAAAVGAPATARWLVRLGGNAAFVSAARAALAPLVRCEELGPDVWQAVRTANAPAERPGAWRWDTLSLRLEDRLDPARVLNPGLLGDVP